MTGHIFNCTQDSVSIRLAISLTLVKLFHFNKRAVYYSTYAIQDQALKEKIHQLEILEKDEWDYNYAQVYVVCRR